VVDDLIGDLFGVVHVDGLQTLFLIDKGMTSAGLEEEAGQKEAFGCGSAKSALRLDYR
jgi:hypothetical protein